jgi:hypothetical protein
MNNGKSCDDRIVSAVITHAPRSGMPLVDMSQDALSDGRLWRDTPSIINPTTVPPVIHIPALQKR